MRIRRANRPRTNQAARVGRPRAQVGPDAPGPGVASAAPVTDALAADPQVRRVRERRPRLSVRLQVSMLGAMALGVLLLAGPGGTAVAGSYRTGIHFKPPAAVGALFTWAHGRPGRHFCTAAVVHSPQRDLLITAAHCVLDRKIGSFVFAPGWYKGRFPHGIWPVSRVFVDKAWSATRDANDDFAFLVAGRRGRIERHTGAEILREYQKLPVQAQVIGYPNRSSEPITCTGPARAFDPGKLRQIKFYCGGYTTGTSGGPFLIDVSAKTDDGDVIGVIGGYQRGGDTSAISYSPQFRTAIRRLYEVVTSRK